jgi:hypothetical protein
LLFKFLAFSFVLLLSQVSGILLRPTFIRLLILLIHLVVFLTLLLYSLDHSIFDFSLLLPSFLPVFVLHVFLYLSTFSHFFVHLPLLLSSSFITFYCFFSSPFLSATLPFFFHFYIL